MGRPFRLVDHRHVVHFDRYELTAIVSRQCPGRHWNNPVKPRVRDRRMEVMHLIFRTKLATEKRQSDVGKSSCLRRPGCPVFTIHDAVIGRLGAKQEAFVLAVRTHAAEAGAPSYPAFKVVDM